MQPYYQPIIEFMHFKEQREAVYTSAFPILNLLFSISSLDLLNNAKHINSLLR